MFQHLNKEELEQLKKIWDTDYQTIVSGKDNGIPFLTYVFKLHKKIFGETCTNCPYKIEGYIKKIKLLNPKNKMETKSKSNFTLKGNTTIPVPGTSISYSNANLTDEIALELIAKNPNRKALFSKLPENLDALLNAFDSQNSKASTPNSEDLVKIGETSLTIEQAISLLAKVGLETKATTVKGILTAIGKLSKDKHDEFMAFSLGVKGAIHVNETTEATSRSKDEILFDLEKAQQDLTQLQQADPVNEEAVAEALKLVEDFKIELGKAE